MHPFVEEMFVPEGDISENDDHGGGVHARECLERRYIQGLNSQQTGARGV